jgi:hypothetical protein
MALQTTGTGSTVAYDTRTVIDRAYGALGLTPQQITSEKIDIARDLLSLVLTDLVNTANPLWCLEKSLITLIQGQRNYVLPQGTSDVNRAFYRTSFNVTPAVFTNTSAAYLFDFGLNASGGNNDVSVSMWSIAWTGAPVPVTFQSSEDGVTWTNVYQTSALNFNYQGAGSTQFYEMRGQNARRFWQVIPTVVVPANTLSIASAALYNNPNDIMMYRMNKDDYWNMTNKSFQGRPLQYWLNREINPSMDLWPQPDAMAAQNLMWIWRQRYIMDVGSLQQTIEVPTRWYYTIIFALGDALAFCTPEAKPDRIALVQARAQQMLKTTWTEERDKSPFKMNFGLRQYTR